MINKFLFIFFITLNVQAQINFEKLNTSEGREYTKKEMNSGTKVVSFFFSSCAHTCLLINAKLKNIKDKIEKDKKIEILSVTVDPNYDTVKVLAPYAKKWRKNSISWKFITGQPNEIFRVIKDEFKLPGGGKAFVHSESVIILKDGKKINTYSLFNEKELKSLDKTLEI